MASDSTKLAAFIKPQEGYVLTNRSTDAGGWTMCGITWLVFQQIIGNDFERFKVMSPTDWNTIFKKVYWDKACADLINSQRIANAIVDWVFNAGSYFPELDIQKLLDAVFELHIAPDGQFGPQTVQAINSVNEEALYEDINNRRKQFYQDLCVTDRKNLAAKYPTITDEATLVKLATENNMKFLPNLQGWLNRIQNLIDYNAKYIK